MIEKLIFSITTFYIIIWKNETSDNIGDDVKSKLKINRKIMIVIKLIYQKKRTGASRTAAKLKAAWASPSLAAPSPK